MCGCVCLSVCMYIYVWCVGGVSGYGDVTVVDGRVKEEEVGASAK